MPMFEFPGNEGGENSISAKHQKKTYFHARGTHGTKEFVVEIHVDIWVGGSWSCIHQDELLRKE